MDYRQFNEHHKSRLVACYGRVGLTKMTRIKPLEFCDLTAAS